MGGRTPLRRCRVSRHSLASSHSFCSLFGLKGRHVQLPPRAEVIERTQEPSSAPRTSKRSRHPHILVFPAPSPRLCPGHRPNPQGTRHATGRPRPAVDRPTTDRRCLLTRVVCRANVVDAGRNINAGLVRVISKTVIFLISPDSLASNPTVSPRKCDVTQTSNCVSTTTAKQ